MEPVFWGVKASSTLVRIKYLADLTISVSDVPLTHFNVALNRSHLADLNSSGFRKWQRSTDGVHMDMGDTFSSVFNLTQLLSWLWKWTRVCCRQAAIWEQSEGSNQCVRDHYGKSTGAFVLWGKAKFTSSVCISVCLFLYSFLPLDSAFPCPPSAPSCFALGTIKGFKWLCVRLCVWLAGRGFNIPVSSLYTQPKNEPGSSFYIVAANFFGHSNFKRYWGATVHRFWAYYGERNPKNIHILIFKVVESTEFQCI